MDFFREINSTSFGEDSASSVLLFLFCSFCLSLCHFFTTLTTYFNIRITGKVSVNPRLFSLRHGLDFRFPWASSFRQVPSACGVQCCTEPCLFCHLILQLPSYVLVSVSLSCSSNGASFCLVYAVFVHILAW